ncbi:MAG: hypothetical protein JW771_06050 [Candidatus Thermoplasmatota archaeon]|nr:hypothetical protein [Candidatus Thermoplasmatota archaeon]
MRDTLTFEDGILLCKHIYQNAIEKTLQGVMEQEQIFQRAHEALSKLERDLDNERIDELLYLLNLENIYSII